MKLTQTSTDARITQTLTHLRAQLAKCPNQEGWTADKIRESIAYQERQLALARPERCKYEDGSI